VDAVIIGSAESSLPLLARSLCSGRATGIDIPGVMMRGAAGSPARGNDAIPEWFPRRDLQQRYWFQGLRSAKVIMSRGCPYRCGFCAVGSTFPFSERSLDSIGAELGYLFDSGVRLVDIEDDNLFHDRYRAHELLQILQRYHRRGMQFAAMNGINASHLRGLVDECIEAGFIEFNLSMISAAVPRPKRRRPFEPANVAK
jgi:radical SAM superfamily enzyme YgiQ (UPF0313 family)